MEWESIYSKERFGLQAEKDGERTDYQRDFDRIIFSSGFRRLQNKTQVFPLPGSTFVHNRLTHSLEVASVGRSLGKIVGKQIFANNSLKDDHLEFYKYELQNVIASACLAHDIGNPAFGHSGEKAISNFFIENEKLDIFKGKTLRAYFNEEEWLDVTNFEGNANALRILTHFPEGGGYRLTYSTLAALIKYPCEVKGISKKDGKHRSKFGFFQSDKAHAIEICKKIHFIEESKDPLIYKRHPFVFLTEAADDICYRIIDLEDAHRLGIISYDKIEELFTALIENISTEPKLIGKVRDNLEKTIDPNEKVAYLRAKCINELAIKAASVFMEKSDLILKGELKESILEIIEKECDTLGKINDISEKKVYNHSTVVEIEMAGYNVMFELLKLFIPSILKDKKEHKDKKIIQIIPLQFIAKDNECSYEKVMKVLDYISGMTDPYATELYRKLRGIEIPKHK